MSIPFPSGKSFVFSLAEFATRFLGLVFLARFMSTFGLDAGGVYRTALPLIFLASAVGSVGLPTALTRWLAADGLPSRLRHDQLLTTLLATFGSMVLTVGSLFGLLYASVFAFLGINAVDDLLWFSLPMILILCVSGSIRGLMIGQGQNVAPALAQILTGLVQVLLVNAWTLKLVTHFDWSGGEAGVLISTLSEFMGMLTLLVIFVVQIRRNARHTERSGHPTRSRRAHSERRRLGFWEQSIRQVRQLRLVTRLAAPPTVQMVLESLGYGLELPMAEYLLTQHFGHTISEQWIAEYAAVVIPLLHFPMFASDGLATALLPTLTAGRVEQGRQALARSFQQVIRFTAMLSLPAICLLFVFAPTFTRWLDAPEAATLLRVTAPLALLVYIQSPLESLIQAHGHSRSLLWSELVGDIVRLCTLWVAIDTFGFGIWGLVLAFALGVSAQTTVLFIAVWRLTPIRMPWRTFGMSWMASVAMCAVLMVGAHQPEAWSLAHWPVPWFVLATVVALWFLFTAGEIPSHLFADVPVVGPPMERFARRALYEDSRTTRP